MASIGKIMDDHDGIGPGFDALRVGLAMAVVLRHCFPITYGTSDAAGSGFLWAATMAIVPAFFALSGFLVTGSALRLTLGKFVASRVLRIVPALAVDTLFTILVIGPLFTTLAVTAFFANPMTHSYLLNIVGEIHYFLPGVFEDNPLKGVVNGALWTIPPELGCYVIISGLIFLKWVDDWKKIAFFTAISMAAIVIVGSLPDSVTFPGKGLFLHPGAPLIPNFLLGSLMYLKRHSIPYSPLLFGACIAAILGCGLFLPASDYATLPTWTAVMIPVYAYCAMFLGVTRIPQLPFFNRGDYSYGIYLYGFPIQQAVVAAFDIRNPFVLFATAMPLIVLLAVASWHLVEKPTLKLRKGFSMAAKREEMRQAAKD